MKLTSIVFALLSISAAVQAAPMTFDKRRFGQEHTPAADATFQEIKDIAQGTDKEAQAGNLSGAMVRALLAKAPACDQQDRADEIIDLGKQLGGDKLQQMIKLAQTYRQLERNTPKDGQPSELCNKAPKNKELNGLTQAQDPTGNGKNPDAKNPDAKNPDAKNPDAKNPDAKNPDAKNPGKNPDAKNPDGKNPDAKNPDAKNPKAKNPKDGGDGSQNVAETDPVGGVKMPKIQKNGADFLVNGNTFKDVDAAHGRQCDIQHNGCFNKLNSGDKSFTNTDCDNQTNVCKSGPPVFETK